MVSLKFTLLTILFASLENSAQAFGPKCNIPTPSTAPAYLLSQPRENSDTIEQNRRSFLTSWTAGGILAMAFTSTPSEVRAEQAPEYRQGIKVDAFNGLIFNYRGGDFGGLDANSIDEPNVSYAEFNQRLSAGEVEFVEFLAPDGDKAYVTFKGKADKLRIGEGYPIEKHDGYSSPMFCVRAVKNAGVPYKFVVPWLAKYSATS
jgi:hypothetical protein